MQFLIVLAAGFAVCVARPVPSSQRFSLYGEDGSDFATQARTLGIFHSIFTAHNGYLNLLPRLVGAVASALPLHLTPDIFSVCACAIAATAAACSWSCAKGVGLGPAASLVVAGSVVVLPAGGAEVVDSVAYTEWYCLTAAVVFVAAWIGGYRPPAWIVAALLFVAATTSPVVATTLPFAVAVYWTRKRTRYDLVVLLGLTGGVAAQVIARLLTTTPTSKSIEPFGMLNLYLIRVVDGAVTGARLLPTMYDEIHPIGAALLALVLLLSLTALGLARLEGRCRLAFCFLLAQSVLLFLMPAVLRPGFYTWANIGFGAKGNPTVVVTNGRYFAGSAVVLVVAALLAVGGQRSARGSAISGAGTVLVAVIGVGLLWNVPTDLGRFPISQWDAEVNAARLQCAQDHGAGRVAITNAPGGIWQMRLTCHEAFGSSGS